MMYRGVKPSLTARRGAVRALGSMFGGCLLALALSSTGVAGGSGPTSDVGMNMDKVGDKSTICAGDSVTFTLTTRLLGGAPGVQLRDISATDSNLPGVTLVPGDEYFVAASDLGGDGLIAFLDEDDDGKNDEEFVWTYTLTYLETTENVAVDVAEVWFDGSFVDDVTATDSWTVTVDPMVCPTTTTSTTTTTTTIVETTTTLATTTSAAAAIVTSTSAAQTPVFAGPLPATGDPSTPLALVALVLVGAGSSMILLVRR